MYFKDIHVFWTSDVYMYETHGYKSKLTVSLTNLFCDRSGDDFADNSFKIISSWEKAEVCPEFY